MLLLPAFVHLIQVLEQNLVDKARLLIVGLALVLDARDVGAAWVLWEGVSLLLIWGILHTVDSLRNKF